MPIRDVVRAIRSYMAGIGAAGSLIFGAAILFVVASALVALKGWPKPGAMASPVVQRVPATPGHRAAGTVGGVGGRLGRLLSGL
jgi:hypothetical protein